MGTTAQTHRQDRGWKRQRTSEMQVITKSKQEPKLNNIIKAEQ